MLFRSVASTAGPVTDDGPAPDTAPAPTRRRGRALLWLLATTIPLGLVVLGGWFGLRAWNDHQYHVGVHDSHLALFRGSPDAPFGWEPEVLVEANDVQVSRIADEAQRSAIEHNAACATTDEQAARRCFAQQRQQALFPTGTTATP